MNDIKLYDTVKDGDGNRYRIIEVGSDGTGHVVAKLRGITPDNKAKRGPARLVEASVLESEYKRIDLPPVTVSNLNDEPDLTLEAGPSPSERAARKQQETVGEYNKKDIEVLIAEAKDLRKTISKMRQDHEAEISRMKHEHEAEILDLKDQHMEEVALFKAQLRGVEGVREELNQCRTSNDLATEVIDDLIILMAVTRDQAEALTDVLALMYGKLEGIA